MRRSIVSALALVPLGILLGGCPATTGTPPTNTAATPVLPIPPVVPDSAIKSVQAQTNKVCGYIADYTPIANLLATLAGQGTVASAITTAANEICGAVTTQGAMLGAGGVYVRGVALTGHFTRSRGKRT